MYRKFKAWLYPTSIFDHFKYAEEYLKAGIPVYVPEEAHGTLSREYDEQKVVHDGGHYEVGRFTIYPFPAFHDVDCLGYAIVHPDTGMIIFATDTAYIKKNFKQHKPSHILIECNHSWDAIDRNVQDGTMDMALANRIKSTHMSLETCRTFVSANKTSMLDNVILLHLSDSNSNSEQFRNEMQEVVGKDTRVWVADKGLEVRLDLFPW